MATSYYVMATSFRICRGHELLVVFFYPSKIPYIASRVQDWETDCEILWVKLQLTGSVPLHIAAYYKPSESDTHSSEEFRNSK